ncbi:VCX1 [Symbiodinium microadriaticum]|nr:VCX1 [Symbiodinium microadriaticum]
MALFRRRPDLQGVPHLRTFVPLWDQEVWDHLNCMPWPLACRVAQAIRSLVQGMQAAWQWWALNSRELRQYLEELEEATQEFPVLRRMQQQWTTTCDTEESFVQFFIIEAYIRIEMTSEAISWPVTGQHLPCWEVLLRQGHSPELCG